MNKLRVEKEKPNHSPVCDGCSRSASWSTPIVLVTLPGAYGKASRLHLCSECIDEVQRLRNKVLNEGLDGAEAR